MTDNGFSNVILADAGTNIVYTTPLNFIKTYRYGISENLSIPLTSWLDNNNQLTLSYTRAKSKMANIKDVFLSSAPSITTTVNKFSTQPRCIAEHQLSFWKQQC